MAAVYLVSVTTERKMFLHYGFSDLPKSPFMLFLVRQIILFLV